MSSSVGPPASRTDAPMAALPPPRSVRGLFLLLRFVPCFQVGGGVLEKGLTFGLFDHCTRSFWDASESAELQSAVRTERSGVAATASAKKTRLSE
jgi:hypothetical protein